MKDGRYTIVSKVGIGKCEGGEAQVTASSCACTSTCVWEVLAVTECGNLPTQ